MIELKTYPLPAVKESLRRNLMRHNANHLVNCHSKSTFLMPHIKEVAAHVKASHKARDDKLSRRQFNWVPSSFAREPPSDPVSIEAVIGKVFDSFPAAHVYMLTTTLRENGTTFVLSDCGQQNRTSNAYPSQAEFRCRHRSKCGSKPCTYTLLCAAFVEAGSTK